MNDFYGKVGNSTLEENNENREINGFYNKYDEEFYKNGPQYKEEMLEKERKEREKAAKDNTVGSIILLIIIIILLVIFVIPTIIKGV